jgi:hypothetical protein
VVIKAAAAAATTATDREKKRKAIEARIISNEPRKVFGVTVSKLPPRIGARSGQPPGPQSPPVSTSIGYFGVDRILKQNSSHIENAASAAVFITTPLIFEVNDFR